MSLKLFSRSNAKLWLVSVLAVTTIVLVGAVVVRNRQFAMNPLSVARATLRTSATISIIGDSTGYGPGAWPTLWAGHLGRKHRVELHQWEDGNRRYSDPPLTYGGNGAELTIWNAGKPGGQTNWAAGQLELVEPKRPNLIILNVGHNNTSMNVESQLDTMRILLAERWGTVPLVVILQNPGRGDHAPQQSDTLVGIRAWTLRNGVPIIDVTSAFNEPDRLMVDNAHPNPAGSKVWADTVADALG